jgi:F0F1-type ATP synthase assembly protein I
VRRQALWVVGGQVLVALIGGLLAYLLAKSNAGLAARSAMVGGGISAWATLTMVIVGLRNSAGKTPKEVMGSFYRGSALKFAVTVLLFVWALRGMKYLAAPMFVTYAASFLVYWFALARSLTSRVGA